MNRPTFAKTPAAAPAPFRSGIPDDIPIGYQEIDRDGRIRFANAALSDLLGRSRRDLIGRPVASLLADPPTAERILAHLARGKPLRNLETLLRRKDGTICHVLLDLQPGPDRRRSAGGGAVRCYVRDVTSHVLTAQSLAEANRRLQGANQELEQMAWADPLTGLLNRRGLQEVLSQVATAFPQCGDRLQVLLVDLDDFKRINDALGYSAGDAVLQEIGLRIRSAVRATDPVARIGGDEFVVLLPGASSAEASVAAEKVRLAIAEEGLHAGGSPLRVTASIGTAAVAAAAGTVDVLIAETYEALRIGKQSGKNRVAPAGRAERTTAAEGWIASALEALRLRSTVNAVTQTIRDAASERIVAYELLTRSSLPSLENPEDFFRLGQEAGAMTQIDRNCLDACLRACADLPPRVRRHVNLLPATVSEISAARLLEAFPPAPRGSFCVEISQRRIVTPPRPLVEAVRALKREGIVVAVDHVGWCGAIETLVRLEPDIVKIDRSCAAGISRDPERTRFLERLLRALRALDCEVIATGIESRGDLETLRRLGVRYGQGFLWDHPATTRGGRTAGAR